ncbi:MAG: hypothetical protein V4640_05100 [Verrucomicrobiota bacterium]
MNTNPDEATLALWLDDELTGEELAAVEAWAAGNPDQLAARDEIRKWRSMISAAVPAVVEPPYPDFFNSRVMQGIRDCTAKPVPRKPLFFRNWLMPMAACAGMALAFWIGKQSHAPVEPVYNVAGAPRAIPVDPVLYTPEKGVDAEWFASDRASATVIVLSGVAAIPDSTDFSETVYLPMARDIDSTAHSDLHPATFKN